jgi:hypothetical protein
MAAPNQYQAIFRTRVAAALKEATSASELRHNGVKGAILETLVSKLFSPLLPSDIGVGTGQIIDSYSGALSHQMDIVLYDRSILPPILFDAKLGLFPVESVLYAIEVKTTLSASELRSAHDAAKELANKFGYRSGLRDKSGSEVHHSIEKLRSVVFALKSDLCGASLTEAERYRKIYGDDVAYLRAICVAGREYWFDDGNFWVGTTNAQGYDEVLAFIGGITNTYRSVSLSRGNPSLGEYIMPEVRQTIGAKSRNVASVSVTCEKCGATGEMVPELPIKAEVTVNGALVGRGRCPHCNADMRSASGQYLFRDGRLVS